VPSYLTERTTIEAAENPMSIRLLSFATVLLLLSGCGAEVASTAVTAAELQAQQAEQAKAQEEQFKRKLGEAMQATEEAASAAGNQ
jgi:outer membrane biogenesis lipoprotein LolB